MITCTPGSEQMLMAILDTSTALSTEQKAALVAELTDDPEGRGYSAPIAAGNWEQVRFLLLGHYSVQVPETTTPRASMPQAEFQVLASRIAAAAGTGNAQQKGVWTAVKDAVQIACMFVSVNLQDPDTQMMVAGLNQAGLLTSEQYAALTVVVVPEHMETRDPRSWSVLGEGIVIEVSDLVALRVEGLI
jgi:hypothetical protein